MDLTYSTNTKQHLHGREDSKRHVIFLDIDGVLQPCWSQKRFDHDLEQTRAEIADKMKDDAYLKLDKYGWLTMRTANHIERSIYGKDDQYWRSEF